MPISAFKVITILTNEKAATLVAYSIYKAIPRNRLTYRIVDAASLFAYETQHSYDDCVECHELIFGKHTDPFIHDRCAQLLRDEEEYWNNVDAEEVDEQAEQEKLQRQFDADEAEWQALQQQWEIEDRLRRKVEEEEAEDHDEEDLLGSDSDETYATAPIKEN